MFLGCHSQQLERDYAGLQSQTLSLLIVSLATIKTFRQDGSNYAIVFDRKTTQPYGVEWQETKRIPQRFAQVDLLLRLPDV